MESNLLHSSKHTGNNFNINSDWSRQEDRILAAYDSEDVDFDALLKKHSHVFRVDRTAESLSKRFHFMKQANVTASATNEQETPCSGMLAAAHISGPHSISVLTASDNDSSDNDSASLSGQGGSLFSESGADTSGRVSLKLRVKAASQENVSLSILDSFSASSLNRHIASMRSGTIYRRFAPVLLKLIEHPNNGGLFNSPVDPEALGIPDYYSVISRPMDLGTVRQRLEAGEYGNLQHLSEDICLVFENAQRYNPVGHAVHTAARRMMEDFLAEIKRLVSKTTSESSRKASHSCSFCHGHVCPVCGDKCLKFDPPGMQCDCCGERIRRGNYYYRSRSGHRWCVRCVTTGGKANAQPGAVLPPISPSAAKALTCKRETDESTAAPVSALSDLAAPARDVSAASASSAASDCSSVPTTPSVAASDNDQADGSKKPRIVLRLSVSASAAADSPTSVSSAASKKRKNRPGTRRRRSSTVISTRLGELEKRRNDDVVAEPWVQCDDCHRWFHQVCVLFNARKHNLLTQSVKYTCPLCRLEAKTRPVTGARIKLTLSSLQSRNASSKAFVAKGALEGVDSADERIGEYCASALPHTALSKELERRVRARIAAEASPTIANSIVVRVVSSLPQQTVVPEEVRRLFCYPQPPAEDYLRVKRWLHAMSNSDERNDFMSPPAVSPLREEFDDSASIDGENASAQQYPKSLQYRQRVVMLWQRLDGVDVCLFALYVQEYGNDCPEPNRNKVYIAYLDSVRYLRPLTARTAIYHELLVAYLTHTRKRGFQSAYIWSCPPQRGDAYIFHRHPPQQRTPSKERLRSWYDALLEQAQQEGIVSDVTQLYDQYFDEDCNFKPSAGLVPYFVGDFWAMESERIIREAAKPTKPKAKSKQPVKPKAKPIHHTRMTASAPAGGPADEPTPKRQRLSCPAGSPHTQAESPTADATPDSPKALSEASAAVPAAPAVTPLDGAPNLLRSLGQRLKDMRREFIVAHFSPLTEEERRTCSLPGDNSARAHSSERISCDFFNARQGFLRMCQGNNYQFDTLRRAKHSSAMVLYHLHNPDVPAFARICNGCDTDIGNRERWHCNVCNDFDLCSECQPVATHEHELELQRSTSSEQSPS